MDDAASATTHGDTPGRPTWTGYDFDCHCQLAYAHVGCAPTETGGSDITGYELRIWSGGQWVDEATLGNVLTYTDRTSLPGTKYYYIVRAINSQGAGLWSAYKAGTTTAAAPDAPVLTATATGMNVIRLTWTVPNDNGMISPATCSKDGIPPDAARWPLGMTANLLGT